MSHLFIETNNTSPLHHFTPTSHKHVYSNTRLYRHICICYIWHSFGFCQAFRLIGRILRRLDYCHWRRHHARPLTEPASVLDDKFFLPYLYRLCPYLGNHISQVSHLAREYLVPVRHDWTGSFCRRWHRKDTCCRFPILDSHNYGYHDWCRRGCIP